MLATERQAPLESFDGCKRLTCAAYQLTLGRGHAAHKRLEQRHVGGVLERPWRATGILPARLGPKIAFREGLLEARNDRFHRRINDLERYSRPAYYRHAAPEGRNRAA
jgi:hypothetical protein